MFLEERHHCLDSLHLMAGLLGFDLLLVSKKLDVCWCRGWQLWRRQMIGPGGVPLKLMVRGNGCLESPRSNT